MSNRTEVQSHPKPEVEPLLTPQEVAQLFRVDPKTVTRWAKAGRISSIKTLGGHRRYRRREVDALLRGEAAAGPARSSRPTRPAKAAKPAVLSHTVGVEVLTAELRATDPAIPANAVYAVVERGSGGSLIKVGTSDVDALQYGYSLTDAAANYAKTVGATYVEAGA